MPQDEPANWTHPDKERVILTLDAIMSEVKELKITNLEQTQKLNNLELVIIGNEMLRVAGALADIQYIKNWISQMKFKIAYTAGAVSVIVIMLKMFWDWIVVKLTGR